MNLVVTGCSEEMKPVGDLTSSVAKRYARFHGYEFEQIEHKEFAGDGHPSWQKLRLILKRIPQYDAILWLDADTLITNPFVKIEHRLAGKGLIVSMDWSVPNGNDPAYFSTGNFIVSNCKESIAIFKGALKRDRWANEIFWDQSALQEEFRYNQAIQPFVHILSRRLLNAVPAFPNMTVEEPWEPGDFLAHLTNRSNEERIRLIKMQ